MPRLYVFFIACVTSFVVVTNAYAFKVDTHIWIGQQVLNDLQDGSVTIPINGVDYNYTVRNDIVQAIINNSDKYRMGNVGPDGFPDIITGQQVVHPGVISWKTDDWLKWITTRASESGNQGNIAFAQGYLSHAAADVFAHTYVNQYSGGSFDLSDNEIDVEVRHILLEQFISRHTPPLIDSNGNNLGEYYNNVSVPSGFITDELIMNPTVAALYGEAGVAHLKLIYELREQLKEFVDGPITDLEIAVMRYYLEQLTGKEFSADIIPDEVFKTYRDVYNDIFLQEIVGYKYANSAIDLSQDAQTWYIDTISKLAETSLDEAQDFMDKVIDYGVLNVEIANLGLEIADAAEKARNSNEYIIEEVYDIVERAICNNGNSDEITLLHRKLSAQEKNDFQSTYNIVMTPDGFPIIWNDNIKTKKVDDVLDGLGRDNYKLRGVVVKANAQYQEALKKIPELISLPRIHPSIPRQNSQYVSVVRLGLGSLFNNTVCFSQCDSLEDDIDDILDSVVDSTEDLISHIESAVENATGINAELLVFCPTCAETVSTGAIAANAASYALTELVENKYNYCLIYPNYCSVELQLEVGSELFCEVDKVLERIGVKDPILNPNRLFWKEAKKTAQDLLYVAEAAREEVKESIHDVSDTVLDEYLAQLQFQNDFTNIAIDLGQELVLTDVNPLRAYLNGWIDDIDVAMRAYVQTNASIIKETMKPDGDPVAPLNDWFECEFFKIVGVSGDVINASCLVQDRYAELLNLYNELQAIINPVGFILDLALNELQEKIEKEAIEEISERVGTDIEEFIEILQEEASANVLNAAYATRTGVSATGEQVKLLLPISDIAARVTSEMQVKPDGSFDENNYAVIYNAIILSKLSLLDASQLNELAMDAGITNSIYTGGQPLYNSADVTNILFDSIKSIDGNHQWMHEAPPYPRQDGDTQEVHVNYGYIYDGSNGFRLWQDPTVRDQVFLKIFKGPLVPGVDAPETIGHLPILPASYPYKVCEFNPYPLSIYDKSCVGGSVDGDDLSDVWELQWIGNLLQSGNDNPDNDSNSNSNLVEFQNGTNPLQ